MSVCPSSILSRVQIEYTPQLDVAFVSFPAVAAGDKADAEDEAVAGDETENGIAWCHILVGKIQFLSLLVHCAALNVYVGHG